MAAYEVAMGLASGPAPTWSAVLTSLEPALAAGDVAVLEAVLRHDGLLRLAYDHSLPHSMSPESMMKSLAAQAAARLGLRHLVIDLAERTDDQALRAICLACVDGNDTF